MNATQTSISANTLLRLTTSAGKYRRSFAFQLGKFFTNLTFLLYTAAFIYLALEMADEGRSLFGEIGAYFRFYKPYNHLYNLFLILAFLIFWSIHLFSLLAECPPLNVLTFLALAFYSVLFSLLYLENSPFPQHPLPLYIIISGAIWTTTTFFYLIDLAYLTKLELADAKMKVRLEKSFKDQSEAKPSAPGAVMV